MCGAFTTPKGWNALELQPNEEWEDLDERFAVRPFDSAVIVCDTPNGVKAGRADQWSLIPPFAKERQLKYSTFNARLDKLHSSAVWKTAFPNRRCLVPANGFFERVPAKGAKKKRPYYVHRSDQSPFCFAGLWSKWHDEVNQRDVLSFTIITTQANEIMEKIGHHRMPCIVNPEHYEQWLSRDDINTETLCGLIATPQSSASLNAYPVGYEINFRNQRGKETIQPIN